jgi:hypothetical protein
MSAQSPSVKRQAVLDQAARRRAEVRRTRELAERGLGVSDTMRALEQKAKVAALQEAKKDLPKGNRHGELAWR